MQDKVCLVTGAGSGLGRAAAVALARAGGSVVVVDTDADGGEETVAAIEGDGGRAVFARADVSVWDDVEAAVRVATDRFGSLDCAINNAAIEGERGTVTECTIDNWNRVLSVNLTGIWHCMRAEIPTMLEGGRGGAIVNVSSIVAHGGRPRLGPYVASKHGVVGLTKSAALEFAEQGIRINAACPGSFHTPMTERLFPGGLEPLVEETPVKRVAPPSEIAESLVWLCSEASSFVTGSVLSVDGGKSAW